MTVRYIDNFFKVRLVKGKIYSVISIENGCYRIVDETEEDYLFSPKDFEIVDGSDKEIQGEYR